MNNQLFHITSHWALEKNVKTSRLKFLAQTYFCRQKYFCQSGL